VCTADHLPGFSPGIVANDQNIYTATVSLGENSD
jgi:hypothetical protein